MITVKHLQKDYGTLRALNDVSFTAHKGEILALLGPNGAGKTTAMRILTGFIEPDRGTVEINEELLGKNSLVEIQNKIGYLPENAPLYPDLNVYEHLDLAASVHGITGAEKEKSIRRVADTCGLVDKMYFEISELSSVNP